MKNNKTQQVYKVVSLPKGSQNKQTYYSSATKWLPNNWKLSYRINRWKTPSKGLIYAFKTFQEAESLFYDLSFYDKENYYFIFLAEAVVTTKKYKLRVDDNAPCIFDDYVFTDKQLLKQWTGVTKNTHQMMRHAILCEKLKLRHIAW